MLKVDDLSFSYDEYEVIKKVSFDAKPGEITAIIGANGTGKSTLLRCISGLEKCGGDILFFDKNCRDMDMKERMDYIGYLDQSTDCFVDLNVYEVVLLGLIEHLSFRVKKEEREMVNAILKRMSLFELADRKISELSGGQRQMVFIAQTLVKNPKILIMDEPTSALDLNKQFVLMDFLKEITKEQGYISLITLHHIDVAMKYADKVIVLNDGIVYSAGPPSEVIHEKMLEKIYKVEAEICCDKYGCKHIYAINSLPFPR